MVGALAVARLCESLGTPFTLGGIAWERLPIDPHPGPRPVAQIQDGRPLGEAAVLAGPRTATPEGVAFSEARMAAHLGTETLLVDVTGGTVGAAAGIAAAVEELGCDLLVCVDVGGDVLARGDEPGLASPLCDAVMVAAALRLAPRIRPLLAVIGPGCDGELTADEVLARVAELARAGAWLGTWGLTPEIAAELEAAAHRGADRGKPSGRPLRPRGGGRPPASAADAGSVELGPVGALTFVFDPVAAPSEALPLAHAVAEAASIEEGRAALAARGVHTELDYERSRAPRAASRRVEPAHVPRGARNLRSSPGRRGGRSGLNNPQLPETRPFAAGGRLTSTGDGVDRDGVAELRRSARGRGQRLRAAHPRRARGPAPAPRGALRRGAGRDHRDRAPNPGLARRGAPLPPRRSPGGGVGGAPLPGRLGDGQRAARPERRIPRPPGRRRGLARRAARHRRAPVRADRGRPPTTTACRRPGDRGASFATCAGPG